jgi:phospholipid/cholesterol/gamma-HCH transport system ATP-binding protein
MNELPAAPSILCRNLSMSFDAEVVLDRLELTVPAGRITTLVGSSGAGKSTLVKHILGLRPPDKGIVMIGDCDVWAASEAELLSVRRNLSALHSSTTVFDGSIYASLSLRENLLAVLYERHAHSASGAPRAHGLPATNPYLKMWSGGRRAVREDGAFRELNERAQELLERFDLVDVADHLPMDVAARIRRRTALACSLATDVPLYILDDPDGAIDAPHRREVINALLRAHERTGATMLITTHDLDLAEAISDEVAVLAGGRIATQGEPQRVLRGVDHWYLLNVPPEPEPSSRHEATPAPARHSGPAKHGRPDSVADRKLLPGHSPDQPSARQGAILTGFALAFVVLMIVVVALLMR